MQEATTSYARVIALSWQMGGEQFGDQLTGRTIQDTTSEGYVDKLYWRVIRTDDGY